LGNAVGGAVSPSSGPLAIASLGGELFVGGSKRGELKGGGSAVGVDGSRGAAKGEKESPFDGLSPLSTVSGLTGGGAAD
jgi:hypothetical protein